jgi:hypothetical protein
MPLLAPMTQTDLPRQSVIGGLKGLSQAIV